MPVCKYLNQKIRKIGEQNGKISSVSQKQKRKKNMKRLSFITQFKIEFLLLFTCCKKMFGKMPDADCFACASYCRSKNVSTVPCYYYFSGDAFSQFTKSNHYQM